MNSPFVPSQDGIYPYELIPQTPPHNTAECTVTVNFPDMQLVGDGAPNRPPAYPATPQQQYQQREYENHMATIDWGPELSKLQAPPFRVHRCHHEGMERGGEGSRFELPDGFPEAVRQMCLVPESVSHSQLSCSTLTVVDIPRWFLYQRPLSQVPAGHRWRRTGVRMPHILMRHIYISYRAAPREHA